MSNIRSRIARLEKTDGSSDSHAEAAEHVAQAQSIHEKACAMSADELRRNINEDSKPLTERRVYMHYLQRKTDDGVERQTIQGKLTEMGWEEVQELRRQAEEKGLSKRSRETLLLLALASERVLRWKVGIKPGQTAH